VNRRAFLATLGPGLLLVSGSAAAQSPGRVYRVGRLVAAFSDPTSTEAFRRGLRELGWDVDRNLVIEHRSAEGNQDRLAALAAELVTSKVDVIVAAGDAPIEAVRRATTTIPIVMAVATDAVERGHVASLPRPGGNVTGLSAFLPELAGKRLEILKEIVPSARRVGVLMGRQPFHQDELTRIRAAAPALSLEIRSVPVKAAGDFADVIRGWAKSGVEALYVLPSSGFTDPYRARIADLALQARLPAMGALDFYAEAGFLASYGASRVAWHHRSAYFVDRILKGAKPADLPVEQPTQFELVINTKTAKALGLTVPPAMLQRADRLIE
jgi:putative ABC transport system substrate-binding protein